MAMWRCFPGFGGTTKDAPEPGMGTARAPAPAERMQKTPGRSDGSEGRWRHLASGMAQVQLVGPNSSHPLRDAQGNSAKKKGFGANWIRSLKVTLGESRSRGKVQGIVSWLTQFVNSLDQRAFGLLATSGVQRGDKEDAGHEE